MQARSLSSGAATAAADSGLNLAPGNDGLLNGPTLNQGALNNVLSAGVLNQGILNEGSHNVGIANFGGIPGVPFSGNTGVANIGNCNEGVANIGNCNQAPPTSATSTKACS